MSKRKDGSEIENVPQPKWPEIAYFDGKELRRIVPRVSKDGSAEYDIRDMDVKAAVAVDEIVSRKSRKEDLASLSVIKEGDPVKDEPMAYEEVMILGGADELLKL